ncbi:MAG TPA: LysR substrate-binding domain-containing protein [Azospirillaceae bacterium]|nr:LysR substrate-binding domain-containing protein [Azospirillaceae bacterium]
MNLRDLRYLIALGEHRHFGRAAEACHVSQPTLSGQLRKLEERLGVDLFERTSKWVVPTEVGERLLAHARRAVEAADALEAEARAARDPLVGPLKLGVIPTLGPYLMPLLFAPLRQAYPRLEIELWEDVTANLLERLQARKLDAVMIATTPPPELEEAPLFTEPFLAALSPGHALAGRQRVDAADLSADLLVLADGHCLRDQALAACARGDMGALRAASLETLVNMVAAGYGSTLIPGLAAGAMRGRDVTLLPLSDGVARTVRLVSRPTFPRAKALSALAETVRGVVGDMR